MKTKKEHKFHFGIGFDFYFQRWDGVKEYLDTFFIEFYIHPLFHFEKEFSWFRKK